MKAIYLILAFIAFTPGVKASYNASYCYTVPMDSVIKPIGIKTVDMNAATIHVTDTEKPKTAEKARERKAIPEKREKSSAVHSLPKRGTQVTGDTIPKNTAEIRKHGLGIPDNCNMAKFPGGEKAIREFVRKNRHYPEECKASRASGTVTVSMTIAPDGTPSEAHIAKSSGNSYMDAEAMRIAGLMPKWDPAKDMEHGQERTYSMKITFRPGR